MPTQKAIRGYHPPYVWCLNGDLSLATTSVTGVMTGLSLSAGITAAGTTNPVDGLRTVFSNVLLETFRITQTVAGSGGTTTVELYRYNLATTLWASLGTVSVNAASGNGAASSLTIAANTQLSAGDLLAVCITAVSLGSPRNITMEATFT